MSAFARVAAHLVLAVLFGAVAAGAAVSDPDRWFEHRAHSDRVTAGAGNSSAANIAVQAVDPWPAHSARKRIDLDGKRAHKAIKRYETNTSIPPNGLDAMRLQRGSGFEPGTSGGK
jgi:hypothetical protein